jgi:hypothetical protein
MAPNLLHITYLLVGLSMILAGLEAGISIRMVSTILILGSSFVSNDDLKSAVVAKMVIFREQRSNRQLLQVLNCVALLLLSYPWPMGSFLGKLRVEKGRGFVVCWIGRARN